MGAIGVFNGAARRQADGERRGKGSESMSSPTIPVARPLLPTAHQIVPYIERIDANRWYTNFGSLCLELEQRIAGRFGLPAQSVVTLANATVGLTLALQTA